MFEKIKKIILNYSLKLKLPVFGIHLIEIIHNPKTKIFNFCKEAGEKSVLLATNL